MIDEEGYFSFLDRCNDTYKINGENVSPQFLDDVIGRCQWVNAVETVGISHARFGEVSRAPSVHGSYSTQTFTGKPLI